MNALTIIHAGGDPITFGRAIGEQVGHVFKECISNKAFFQGHLNRWRGQDYVKILQNAAQQNFPRFMDELTGMAEGIGVDFETLFIWNCRGDLAFSNEYPLPHPDGCTTILLPGQNGRHVIAHNEDGPCDLLGQGIWLKAKPDHGMDFESFLYPGMLPGHTLGVNEHGLVQAINNIQSFDLKPGVPRHFIARAVLNCRNLDAALELLNRDDRAGGFHHALMQTDDSRLLSVEAPASGCDVQEIVTPYVHTNHLIRPPLSNIPATISQSSRTRFLRAHELIDQGLKTELLFDRTPGTLSLYRTADDTDFDDEFTLATGIFTQSESAIDFQIMTETDGPAAYRNSL